MIIKVNTTQDDYDIVIEPQALDHIEEYLNLNRKVLIITDSGVPTIYSEKVLAKCKEGYIYTILEGEASKSIENFEKILGFMVEKAFTRTDAVVAVGGGVVGDLSGFVSSCYMRGIDFYNIPTTLLSQVDSSIGGKTAVDFKGVKNIVGSFYQPKKVVIDSTTLKTLSKRLCHAGLVEAIKMAAIYNEDLFSFIENSSDLEKDIDQIIYQSLLIKKDVVEKDPLEKNIRKILNFGHTFGHAIETLSNGSLYHGEAVGIGMLYFSSGDAYKRIFALLKKYELPTSTNHMINEMVDLVKHDKKASGDMISCIWVDKIGEYKILVKSIEEIMTRSDILE